jgi:hypothetical protein
LSQPVLEHLEIHVLSPGLPRWDFYSATLILLQRQPLFALTSLSLANITGPSITLLNRISTLVNLTLTGCDILTNRATLHELTYAPEFLPNFLELQLKDVDPDPGVRANIFLEMLESRWHTPAGAQLQKAAIMVIHENGEQWSVPSDEIKRIKAFAKGGMELVLLRIDRHLWANSATEDEDKDEDNEDEQQEGAVDGSDDSEGDSEEIY